MRRSNRARSTRPAVARRPARTAVGGPPQMSPTWDNVRQWAADNGLGSPDAFLWWLYATASRAQDPSLDPRAAALLRTLQQYSLASAAGQPLPDAGLLPALYGPLVRALSDPVVGSSNVPGIDDPVWTRPLMDPLAEGGRLWPPSPATTLVRMNEVAHQAFGYAPINSDAMLLDLVDRGLLQHPKRATKELVRRVQSFERDIADILRGAGGLRADPAAPRLASDVDIAEARRRWPSVTPFVFEGPYLFVVAPGHMQDPLGQWTAADGPMHVAMIVQDGARLGRLVMSDATGDVIDASGVLQQYSTGPHRLPGASWLAEASGGDPSLLVDLVAPFVRAVREQQPDAVGMTLLHPFAPTASWTRGQGIDTPLAARAFEPAEVLGALLAERRATAAKAITEATASAGGLANMAARAYRGSIATANAPEEVRRLIAAQAMARACRLGATPQERARIGDAVRVLGLPDTLQRQDLSTVCDASANAVRRLYGRL
ncbi:hypothetical protein pqer_cds_238 [Pandoravirus quercus]|uniref:DUF5848 domain-containing protein n=2 Tax=Pandoravirus TaxID=2060084 RepID=A0A2U7U8B0_9VIRU|nr:hypothetical protein pqer_cds_238 [Pandoravirus quercus]AVK74660.1 hypothetical protein pqer_cds_238 [Pandoravirus quercus]QBZ80838.1 hypothetical protein pclt_cds_240 [Pandoravirus celtis]